MTHSRAILLAIFSSFAIALASQAQAKILTTVTAHEPANVVVQAQEYGNGVVSGVIRNLSDDTIHEVTLLIQHSWHWKNEFHPGPPEDNPGRAEYQTISQSIAPGGALEFQYTPRFPLPYRTDGHFTTTVSVQEYTAVGEPPRPLFQ